MLNMCLYKIRVDLYLLNMLAFATKVFMRCNPVFESLGPLFHFVFCILRQDLEPSVLSWLQGSDFRSLIWGSAKPSDGDFKLELAGSMEPRGKKPLGMSKV